MTEVFTAKKVCVYLDLLMVSNAPELKAVLQRQELTHRQRQAAKVLRLYRPDSGKQTKNKVQITCHYSNIVNIKLVEYRLTRLSLS